MTSGETNRFPVSVEKVTIVTSDTDHSLGSAKPHIKSTDTTPAS